jgi:hypothetical protein
MKRHRVVRAKRFESLNAMRAMFVLGGELSTKARIVYCAMLVRAWPWPDDPTTVKSHVGPKRMAAETGMSAVSVSRAWLELERAGWISRSGTHTEQGTIVWRVHASPIEVDPSTLPERGKRMRVPGATPPPSTGSPTPVQGTGGDRSHRRMPMWLLSAANEGGVGARALAEVAVEVCRNVLGNPDMGFEALVSDVQQVVEFWAEQMHPPLDGFRDDLLLMADAFRACPDDLFAKQIRNEDGRGISRVNSIGRLVRPDDWTLRLDLAQAWSRAGRPSTQRRPRSSGTKGQSILNRLRNGRDTLEGQ